MLPMSPAMCREIQNANALDRERELATLGEPIATVQVDDPVTGLERSRLARFRELIKTLGVRRPFIPSWDGGR